MNKKDIVNLIEGRLHGRKKKEVIEWLLKNSKAQEAYHIAKAKHVARSLRKGNTPHTVTKKKIAINVLKYASILVLVFGTWLYTRNGADIKDSVIENKMILITTSVGEKAEVILSDGTKIIVNSNSALSYPNKFIGSTREVILQGEAFFEVTENKDKPFIVNTNEGMHIKVLGTTFNVKSYPEDHKIETTLVTGKVEVIERKDNKTVLLYPSQRATYVKTNDQLIIDKVDTQNFISWKDGKLIYDETPLREVIKDLERAYKVSFMVSSQELMDYKYTGVFDNLAIQEVLNLFELSSPIHYTLKDDYVIFDKQK